MNQQQKKIDRRVAKTKAAIFDAFRELFAETDFDKITITAIAKRADIDRKTFYAHYASVDDLLDEMAGGFVGAVTQGLTVETVRKMGMREYVRTLTNNIMLVLSSNTDMRRHMAHALSSEALLRHLYDPTREHLMTLNATMEPEQRLPERQMEFFLRYYLGGAIAVYKECLVSGDKDALSDATMVVYHCTMDGLSGLVKEGKE